MNFEKIILIHHLRVSRSCLAHESFPKNTGNMEKKISKK